MHNFHLTGGSVDENTEVPDITEVTWEVTLEAGDYTFKCDPHANMVGGSHLSPDRRLLEPRRLPLGPVCTGSERRLRQRCDVG